MAFPLSSLCHTYETIKYVRIQDARLASLRWIFLVLIVVYVVVIEMLGKGGHLEASRVVGTVRFSLRQPTIGDCDPTMSTDPGKPCLNNFLPLDQLLYCEQSNQSDQGQRQELSRGSIQSGNIYPCQIYEAVNAQLIRETSIVIWTKAIIQNETLVCSGAEEWRGMLPQNNNHTCPRTYEVESATAPFYITQPENFTLLLDHAVTAGRICEKRQQTGHSRKSAASYACSTQSSDILQPGRLYSIQEEQCQHHFLNNNSFASATGEEVQSSPPCFIGANQTIARQDFFPVATLLEAAGLDLDSCNTRRQSKGNMIDDSLPGRKSSVANCVQTFRESGATLMVNIVWNDFHPYHLVVAEQPFYYYKVTWIGNVYKEQIPYYTQSYRSHRTLVSAHGIQINVLVTGNFHQFEWLNFWITLTAAIGLLAVANTVVDSCMLYFLPESRKYQEIKYEAPLDLAEPGEIIRDGNVDHGRLSMSDSLFRLEQPLLSQGFDQEI
jgi:hypothetical protein